MVEFKNIHINFNLHTFYLHLTIIIIWYTVFYTDALVKILVNNFPKFSETYQIKKKLTIVNKI